MTTNALATSLLEDILKRFRESKTLAEKAMAQVDDAQFFATIDDESNSIALIVKHMSGNMRSRWTDFLTTDGEKPDRHRDLEFVVDPSDTREALMQRWENGWRLVFDAVEPLTEDQFLETVTIRNEPHTVLQAIFRQVTHYAYHAGQIVVLAKHLSSTDWKTLSVARGRSEEYNRKMMANGR